MIFKAAILNQLNSPLVIDEIEIVNALGVGQALVKINAAGICGAQLGEIAGAKGPDRYLPHLLGHEGGGIVVDVGSGVKHVKEGDHVVLHWRKGFGIEADYPSYKWRNKTVGGGLITAFSEYAVISENRITPIDNNIPFEIAALMGCAVTTGLGLINNEVNLKIGQSIAVIGCGGVGLNVIQGAAMVSANQIIAIDINNDKLKLAKSFGATHTINTEETPLFEEIIKDVRPKGVDVAVDCTGNVGVIATTYECVTPGGKMILVGQPPHDKDLTIPRMYRHYCGKTLLDSQGGLTDPSVDIPRYLELYKKGVLKLDSLITHQYLLEQTNMALDTVRSNHAGRVIIKMEC